MRGGSEASTDSLLIDLVACQGLFSPETLFHSLTLPAVRNLAQAASIALLNLIVSVLYIEESREQIQRGSAIGSY